MNVTKVKCVKCKTWLGVHEFQYVSGDEIKCELCKAYFNIWNTRFETKEELEG